MRVTEFGLDATESREKQWVSTRAFQPGARLLLTLRKWKILSLSDAQNSSLLPAWLSELISAPRWASSLGSSLCVLIRQRDNPAPRANLSGPSWKRGGALGPRNPKKGDAGVYTPGCVDTHMGPELGSAFCFLG